ncbi:hypothetical protein Misp02_39920 [Microtetraspora sp. NBRC 16547]|nr:hypothetical protein Misp02_39920 [Microtetraspora sp. NBRC 16547]
MMAGCLATAMLTGCGAIQNMLTDTTVITASRPFQGSPAENFADGADGIVIPEAGDVGNFSAKDVKDAFQMSKRLLEAAHLDQQTLLGGKPDAFANLLDPEQRTYFLENLDSTDAKKNTRGWVTSFAPGSAELVGPAIKVQSTMSAESGKDEQGRSELWVNYTIRLVYAVRPAGKEIPIIRVMAFVKARHEYWRDEPGDPLRHWDGPSTDTWTAGTECGSKDRFVHPEFVREYNSIGQTDAYDDNAPALKEGECGSVAEI